MNAEEYEKVGQLFHAALELPPEGRSGFLRTACASNEGLRQQVESLLAAHEQAGDFASTPAMNVAARWLARQDEAPGVTGRIGAYEVLSLIGRGGMGEVYLAHDTRLGRKVAVKLLRQGLTSNRDAVRRFEQEARAVSSLNHPNIVTIYEIGDMLERRFIAMELVEGQSLAGMAGRPVDVATLARIGAQLARALSVTHAAGLVHRDIKPENVIVRTDGYVKVLDFGLARLAVRPTVTSARYRHQSRPDSRHAALHVARAGARADRDERQRRVLARRGPLRAGHRHAPIRVGLDARHASRHHDGRGAESPRGAA